MTRSRDVTLGPLGKEASRGVLLPPHPLVHPASRIGMVSSRRVHAERLPDNRLQGSLEELDEDRDLALRVDLLAVMPDPDLDTRTEYRDRRPVGGPIQSLNPLRISRARVVELLLEDGSGDIRSQTMFHG